ncbi:hypothetical protein AGDE_05090 [Angomonas deanei]|uniref:Uncharacterized protein n=1 Tax=Angomonas deanei TaxID=59799 RepID=A0A7G2CAU9_9TRYP|nr:hypothetical protein AGDE_05090 [Angomonas deanei]CAD2216037.1 hypothetical protein, conserved [Angomonas deanei]|eukprot:EPY38839.1 hypothetical protein AGDE_05090 [Angomonas deanei]
MACSRRKNCFRRKTDMLEKKAPLSPALFLTAINLFEPKLIAKSRRAATDALRLIQQGYALVWGDPKWMERSTRSPSPAPRSVYPTPSVSPSPSLVARLDECMQVLLIYANTSPALAQLVAQENYLHLLCFIGSEARELESNSCSARSVEKELKSLCTTWNNCGLMGRVTDTLRESYLLDFLLDYALPPTVCSSKYEGLGNTLADRKHRIVQDMVNSRHGFSTMMEKIPLLGLSGLVAMSGHCEIKLRLRLLDKLASEGAMERLAQEMQSAVEDLRRDSDPVEKRNSGTSPKRRGGSPKRRGRPSLSPGKKEMSPSKQGLAALVQEQDPVRRIGLCIDVLLLLTKPNLRSTYEAEEMLLNPKTAGNAVVRPTVWAGREDGIQVLCVHLLWLACHARGVVGSLVLLLQEQAADCLLHLASYSGHLYGVVVRSIDRLIDGELTLSGDGSSEEVVTLTDPSGLLPLILRMLTYPIHAEANATSISNWFRYLADNLLPQAFEAPTLTNGRRSTVLWGKQRDKKATPILARDVTRAEMRQLSPFFTFSIHLVQWTSWREGAESFLAKIALLAYHVVLQQRRRPTLYYGQASSCYDVVAPLLVPATGRLPGDYESERTPAKKNRKRSKSLSSQRELCFIPSPVRSPVFYEAFSPHTSPTEKAPTKETETSPQNVTRTWRDRLSLRLLFSSFMNDDEE